MKSMPTLLTMAGVGAGVEVEPAVDGQVVAVAAVAVDDRAAGAQAGRERHLVVVELHGARNQRRELEVVAARERQVADLRRRR